MTDSSKLTDFFVFTITQKSIFNQSGRRGLRNQGRRLKWAKRINLNLSPQMVT